MAMRFVAGETLEDALGAAKACNDAGMSATLDYLGENVSTTADAQRARDAYLNIFDRIAQEKLNANVSCKLTHLGPGSQRGVLRRTGPLDRRAGACLR